MIAAIPIASIVILHVGSQSLFCLFWGNENLTYAN